ncbi:MAG: prolyl oligopeptidase family serine peptidase [Planctomycetota bacterium]|nr:prolyl oligopeptidase family serine peptidase [Planctomycetota bacterium]
MLNRISKPIRWNGVNGGGCNTRLILVSLLVALSSSWFPSRSFAQGTKADYERARTLSQRSRDLVFRTRVTPNWITGKPQFWYRVRSGRDSHRFILVDAEHATRRDAFDHRRLATALAAAASRDVSHERLPFQSMTYDPSGAAIDFAAFGRRWRCDLETYRLSPREPAKSDNPSTVKVLQKRRSSRNGGGETSVRFVNRTDERLKLFWLDTAGRRRPYGTIAAAAQRDQHTYADHVWLVVNEAGRVRGIFAAVEEEGTAVIDGSFQLKVADRPVSRPPPPGQSPDGRWQVRIEQHNLTLRDTETDEQIVLTETGTLEDPFVSRFAWSPDSRYLIAVQQRVGDQREVHLIESAPQDQLQPRLHSFRYAKPGDRMPLPRVRLFDVMHRKQIPVDESLFANPWSIDAFHWSPDAQRFTFLYNQRGHQVLRVVSIEVATGQTRALISEENATFIDYAYKQFTHHLDETAEILWMSERDGWNHLYLYDAVTGKVKNRVTQGPWVVRGVDHVDQEKRQIWFRAGGIEADQDPYQIHYCRVNFDGTELIKLTDGDGTHAVQFSPERRFLIDTYSRVDLPPVTELRSAARGTLICRLEQADETALVDSGWQRPERFVANGRDGKTKIYGVIFRPRNFADNQKYPVIEKIYAGPHGAHVPKRFAAFHSAQAMAELGFIVVQIDGMGTSQRSKAFHDVCWQNLADAGFPDRILWIEAAAQAYPQLDLSRVGIYGGSAGGQNTLGGLLNHGEFYKVGVADCGCHDNRMDKIWWNELWMGWPIGPHYKEQSNVQRAHQLQGKLLLIVGELDRNVDPASTMQVVDALVKADKDFDLLVIPGAGHGAAGTPYGRRRQRDFFVRHLLGREPRSE